MTVKNTGTMAAKVRIKMMNESWITTDGSELALVKDGVTLAS